MQSADGVGGSQLIKDRYRFSDGMTVEHIAMNPYLQYFIGLTEYRQTAPFDPGMMPRFQPGTYRAIAKKQYNGFSKSRKKS